MPDGSTVRTTRNVCDACDNVIDVEPTAEVTEWRRTLSQACEHQRAVLESAHVGGLCDCGSLTVEKIDHTDKYGNVLVQTYTCAGCGTGRVEQ